MKFTNLDNIKLIWDDLIKKINNSIGKKTDKNGEIFNDYENNQASFYSHAEGYKTKALGKYSHAEGYTTQAIGPQSHVEGNGAIANSEYSHAGGFKTRVNGSRGFAHGVELVNKYYCQTLIGQQNEYDSQAGETEANNFNVNYPAFEIGGGNFGITNTVFKTTFNGETYTENNFHAGGADYAEMFEWADGNPNNNVRTGLFVSFDPVKPDKIMVANETSKVLGVVTTNPSFIGDDPIHLSDKYKKDEYGKEITINPIEHEKCAVKELMPDYDISKTYIPRSLRTEWGVIGLLGKIIVNQDGTCVAGGLCKSNAEGKATNSTDGTGFYVMKVIDSTHVLILMK